MNGVHDMGGMQDMGLVRREQNEPVFHAVWEGRVYALAGALRARGGAWNIDAFRHGIQVLPPADYLRMTYYERWLAWLVGKLVATGETTQTEIDTGTPDPGSAKATPFVTRETAQATATRRASTRRAVPVTARFKEGQRVRARNVHPTGHTRLPRYVRGRVGRVVRDRGVFVFPDTHAHDLGEQPAHLYSVRFAARELWGEQAPPHDFVYLELWDDHLERP
jgi:nitrile hydratase subunit beta